MMLINEKKWFFYLGAFQKALDISELGNLKNSRCFILPESVSVKLETLFGENFSDVRIHIGNEATMLGARAFTFGNHIFFAPGEYDLKTKSGIQLLAHELTHVVQQRKGRVFLSGDRSAVVNDPVLEAEADLMGLLVANFFFSIKADECSSVLRNKTTCFEPMIQCKVKGCKTVLDIVIILFEQGQEDLFEYSGASLFDGNTQKYFASLLNDAIEIERRDLFQINSDDVKTWLKTNTGSYKGKVYDKKAVLIEKEKRRVNAAKKIQRLRRIIAAKRASVANDVIKNKTFTDIRQEELNTISKDFYLNELYGFKTAKHSNIGGGLRIDQKNSTLYLRDAHQSGDTKYAELLSSLAVKKNLNKTDHRDLFSSSPYLIEKMKYILGDSPGLKSLEGELARISKTPKKLCDGVYLFPAKVGSSSNLKYLHQWTMNTGSTPSIYQIIKGTNPSVYALNPKLDNNKLLDAILKGGAFSQISKIRFGASEKLRNIYSSVSKLVFGLSDFKSHADKKCAEAFKTSTTISNCLKSIDNILHGLSTSERNSMMASRLYELLIDELFLILAVVKPYSKGAFDTIVTNLYKSRVPTFKTLVDNKKLTPVICMESSGMGALTNLLAAALKFYRDKYNDKTKITKIAYAVEEYLQYFELPGFLSKVCSQNLQSIESPKIFITTLNPSTPNVALDIAKMLKKVKDEVAKLKTNNDSIPITLIIDNTVEIDEGKNGQLEKIFSGLSTELTSGNLNIALAKSYQKYASFGSAKIMSGLVMAVNSGNSFKVFNDLINDAVNKTDYINLDESQLMTYFLEKGSSDELKMIQTAAANAKVLHEKAWPTTRALLKGELTVNTYLPSLPFVLRKISFTRNLPKPKGNGLPFSDYNFFDNLFEKMGIEFRNSFSFLNASYLEAGGPNRFTCGQESEEEIMGKFYAVGFLIEKMVNDAPDKEKFSYNEDSTLKMLIDQIVAETKKADNDSTIKLASLLCCAYHILEFEDSRRVGNWKATKTNHRKHIGTLLGHYEKFLKNTNVTGLSPLIKSKLFVNWLKLYFLEMSGLSVGNLKTTLNNDISKIQKYTKNVPFHELALFYIKDLDESLFGKLSFELKKTLSETLLSALDVDMLITIAQQIVQNGEPTKAKFVAEMVTRLQSVFIFDKKSHESLKDKMTLKGSGNLDSFHSKVYTTENELIAGLKKVATFSSDTETAIVSLSRKTKRKCLYFTDRDLAIIDEKFNTSYSTSLKKDTQTLFAGGFKELKKFLDKKITDKNKGKIIESLSKLIISRTNRILINRGLSDGDVVNSAYFKVDNQVNSILKRVRTINKKTLFGSQAKRDKSLFKKIKSYKSEKYKSMYCINELSK